MVDIPGTLDSLRARLATLPLAMRARLGEGGDPAPMAAGGVWGFSGARCPALADLLDSTAGRPPPPPEPPGPATDDGHAPSFRSALVTSSSFYAAEALPAMASVAGITPADLLTLSAAHAAPPPGDLSARRAAFKAAIRTAWAVAETEAGIAAARAGDASKAAGRYEAALSLDPACADALVARGAAAANARRYGSAIADFEAALTAVPGHANAASYLASVKAKAGALGLVSGGLVPPPPGLGAEEVGEPPRPAPAAAMATGPGSAPPSDATLPMGEVAPKKRGHRHRSRSPERRKKKKKKKGSSSSKKASKKERKKRRRKRSSDGRESSSAGSGSDTSSSGR